MGSRQRPSPHTRKDSGGPQARTGRSAAGERDLAGEQERDEEETLAAARDDVDEALPSEEPAGGGPEAAERRSSR